MDARKVVSPKSNVSHVEVIYDNGEFAIAALQWNKKNRIAIRWNGSGDSLGYPQSHSHPTWFVIPKEVALGMAAFQFAMEALRQADRNDTSPYTEKIKELREVLENHFKEQG